MDLTLRGAGPGPVPLEMPRVGGLSRLAPDPIACIVSALSRTVRVSGPGTSSEKEFGRMPARLSRP